MIVEPILDYRKDVAAQIDSDHAKLEGRRQLVADEGRARGRARRLEASASHGRRRACCPGAPVTLGAAALQERTNSLAQEKGIAVQSTQVMKEEAVGPVPGRSRSA